MEQVKAQEQVQTFAAITNDMIAAWKFQHGDHSLRQVDVVINKTPLPLKEGQKEPEYVEETVSFILCKPSRTVVEVAGSHAAKGDMVKSNNTFISNCVLGGDMAMIDKDGTVYATLMDEIRSMAVKLEVRTKKL